MSFDRAIAFVLRAEGETSDHPADAGGYTRWGLSSKSYPDLNLANLTLVQAMELYKRDYWDAIQGDELPPDLALVLFDWAVNSGVHTAVENLQVALGAELKADGIFGPKTLAAVDAADIPKLIVKLLQHRADDRIHQASRPDQRVFLRGWIRRIIALSVEAMQLG